MPGPRKATTNLDQLAEDMLNCLMEDRSIQASTHEIVTAEMGLPADTVFGGDERDFAHNLHTYGQFTIIESDPRYTEYWDKYCIVQNAAVARVLVKFGGVTPMNSQELP